MASYGNQNTRQNTYAVFTQWDYKFNDKWTLTGGLRYNSDKERAEEEARFIANNPLLGGGATNVNYNNYGGLNPVNGGLPWAAGVAQISGPFAIDISHLGAAGFTVIESHGGRLPQCSGALSAPRSGHPAGRGSDRV